jgi:D-serine dehydratase
MPETLEARTTEVLKLYLRDVKALNNETAKRSRFAALIAELFPGTNASTEYARGVEKLIRIQQPTGVKRGRADAYYGNAIIEFENSLPVSVSRLANSTHEGTLNSGTTSHKSQYPVSLNLEALEYLR